jgi:type IV pilus assembly protein PilB
MEQNQQRRLLGEILVKKKIIKESELREALDLQKHKNMYLGEVLIECGYASEDDILIALLLQCHIPYISISKYRIDEDLKELIPGMFARKYQVMPLDKFGETLSVVMADPLNVMLKDQLHQMTGMKISPFIATKSEITKAIDEYYGLY